MKPKQIFFKFHPFLFIALFLTMGVFLWQNNQKETRPIVESVNKKTSSYPSSTPTLAEANFDEYRLLSPSCEEGECLFQSQKDDYRLLGFSTVSGYYTTVTKSAWGKEEDCPSLVITKGSSTTIDFFINSAKSAFHTLSEDNQPVISLFPWNNLDGGDKQKIQNSTEKNPVELVLFFPLHDGMGAPACFSPGLILKVK